MIEWLGALDLTAPTAEAVLNDCAAGMTADHPLARELKERVRSLSFACFTVQTMKQRT